MGQGVHAAQEAHVALPQLEHGPRPDGAGQHRVADQSPALHTRHLPLILKQKIFIKTFFRKNNLVKRRGLNNNGDKNKSHFLALSAQIFYLRPA